MVKIERAIISVSDKEGIVDFSKNLVDLGVEIISTGGTAALLEKNAVRTRSVSELTGFPEMLDGRVKTLHPKVFAGLLARRDVPEHMEQIRKMADRQDRHGGGEPLSVQADRVEVGGAAGRDNREHRHRRAEHDPGRRQELPVGGGGDQPRPLPGGHGRDAGERQPAVRINVKGVDARRFPDDRDLRFA